MRNPNPKPNASKKLPSHAQAVIIGGGIVGASVAYHLAQLGWKDVVLLERKSLTCGTTWHAAGLITRLRATRNLTRLAEYSHELYNRLEAETGQAVGLKQNGSISVALNKERLEELQRTGAMARAFGVPVTEVTKADIARLIPNLNMDGVLGGVHLPDDSQGDPVNITQALIKGAKDKGAMIYEGVEVTKILTQNKNNTPTAIGVTVKHDTTSQDIHAEYVINCGGMWARDIGAMAGVSVPLHACEHFYIVTDTIEGLPRDMPAIRVADEYAYYKEDAGKILLGCFEPNAKPRGMDGIPPEFAFDTLPMDFDHFEPILEKAVVRFPPLATAGIQTFFNGPESFTPDDRYLLGEAPELRHFFIAAGFNSVGIQSAGGAGMVLAEWMDKGHPPMDVWDVDIRRMLPFQTNKTYLQERVSETLGLLFDLHYPYRQLTSSRQVRRSPIHHRLAKLGACFGELAGWERANWYLPKAEIDQGKTPEYRYSWQRQNWFDYHAQEHKAVRESVAFFDLSSFGKILAVGRDAEAVLQHIASNDIASNIGSIVYTPFLNPRGGIETDVTITRLASDRFLINTPAATIRRDLDWLSRHLPEGAACSFIDITPMEAVFAIMGPKSQEFLTPLIPTDLNHAGFPFGTMQEVELASARVRLHRLSFVGEAGWEIHTTADMAVHVFDAIMQRSQTCPLTMAGMHTLDSCRLEKAYRHFGHDITDEDHVLDAGLGFAVRPNKTKSRFGDFIGRDAVLHRREAGVESRLLQFKLTDPTPLLFHNEPILRDGKQVGYIRSGNYGHWLGGAVGLGYVPCADAKESTQSMLASEYTIDVAGKIVTAEASFTPMYDPKGSRMRHT